MYLKLLIYTIIFLVPYLANAADLKEIARERVILKVQTFLNSIHTMEAIFRQVDQQGEERTGQFFLSRPDKMRFDYNDSQKESIVLDQDFFIHYNYELKETNYVPVDSFPIAFLNKHFINLKKDVKVMKAMELKNSYIIDMEVTNEKTKKIVIMEFDKDPIMLKSFIIQDDTGNNINIKWDNIKLNQGIDDEIYSVFFD